MCTVRDQVEILAKSQKIVIVLIKAISRNYQWLE
jgi:hypothetical protein